LHDYRQPHELGAACGLVAVVPQQPCLADGSQQVACSAVEQQGAGVVADGLELVSTSGRSDSSISLVIASSSSHS
jgi:hypothetical protein